jgi:hypothetical protein
MRQQPDRGEHLRRGNATAHRSCRRAILVGDINFPEQFLKGIREAEGRFEPIRMTPRHCRRVCFCLNVGLTRLRIRLF